jgi:glycosyltransferase involved in cell wall biosynthesis
MLKVAYFAVSIQCGGLEKLIFQMCSELKKNYQDIELAVVAFKKYKFDMLPSFEKIGIPVTFLNIDDGDFTVSSFLLIYKWLKSNRPDVIHSNAGNRMDMFVLLAATLAGTKKKICTIHNMDQNTSLKARVAYKLTSAFSDTIIAVSNSAKEFYLKNRFYSSRKLSVIYNCPGLQADKIEPRNSGLRAKTEIKLLHIGSLRIQKGQIYLIKAMKMLEMSNYTFRLDIYGADRFGYGDIVYKEVSDLNLTNVFFKGETEDVETVLQDADILIASSIREALPLVPLEALSIGLPIVATDILPHKEILGPIESKVLVEVSNPKAIADAILNLVNDEVLYTKYSKEALNRSLDFSVGKAAKKHYELYND